MVGLCLYIESTDMGYLGPVSDGKTVGPMTQLLRGH